MAKRMLKTLLVVLAVYVLLLLAIYLFQRKLIYLPTSLSPDERWSPGFPAEVVTFSSSAGIRISGLFTPPSDDTAPVVLILHGNAGNIRSWSEQLRGYHGLGYGGLLLDPQGYGLSEGSPSEQGFIADGEAALSWLESRGIAPGRIVVHGVSIGTGVAIPLGASHELRGLILQSAFTDLARVAQRIFFFIPCGLLIKDRYDNLALATRVKAPVLMLHGARDSTIPLEHGRDLAAALPNLRTLAVADGYGHNDLSLWSDYWRTIGEFLSSLR